MGLLMRLMYVSTSTQTNINDWRPMIPKLDEIVTPVTLPSDDIKLQQLEFSNSKEIEDWRRSESVDQWENLALYPEVYEPLPSDSVKENNIILSGNDIDVDGDGEDSFALATEFSVDPQKENPPEEIPLVKLPDKTPSCPYCKIKIMGIEKLVDHLLRSHGKRKIIFQCITCGRQSENYRSIVCHYPSCKGPTEVVPSGDCVCEECGRSFPTKIGLGQHKRHAHPEVRNQERIEAACPKPKISRESARKCWTKEEEELLEKLVKQYEGERYINKLIAEHIPTKTQKQISDKRRHMKPVCKEKKDPEICIQVEKRKKQPIVTETSNPDHLRAHYMEVIRKGIKSRTINIYPRAFHKILEGTKDQLALVNDTTEDWYGHLKARCQAERETKIKPKRGKTQETQSKRKAANWMKKRAIKKGRYLRYSEIVL